MRKDIDYRWQWMHQRGLRRAYIILGIIPAMLWDGLVAFRMEAADTARRIWRNW